MNVIIIDDEEHARQNLERRLLKIDPDVNIVDSASNVQQAYIKIKNHKPDLIFLDIEMPDGDGFSLLEMFDNIDFDVIFVTAYTDFALKAFELMAIGYITKPIDNELLSKVYIRSKENQTQVLSQEILDAISTKIETFSTTKKIALPTESGLDLVDSETIVKLQSSDGYTNIFLVDGKKMLSSKRLKYFEEKLDSNFKRLHKSIIVNLNFIQKYHKSGTIVMLDGEELPVGRKYKKGIEETITN